MWVQICTGERKIILTPDSRNVNARQKWGKYHFMEQQNTAGVRNTEYNRRRQIIRIKEGRTTGILEDCVRHHDLRLLQPKKVSPSSVPSSPPLIAAGSLTSLYDLFFRFCYFCISPLPSHLSFSVRFCACWL